MDKNKIKQPSSRTCFMCGKQNEMGLQTVPVGQVLSADSTICILFDDGKKITALGTSGFIVRSNSQTPSYLVTIGTNPKAQDFISGIQVKGQLRLSNGGAIKLY